MSEVTCPLAKNKPALIGIAVGIFVAGLAVGYSIYANSYSPMTMMQDPQHMAALMQDPEFAKKWTEAMMGNPSGRHSR